MPTARPAYLYYAQHRVLDVAKIGVSWAPWHRVAELKLDGKCGNFDLLSVREGTRWGEGWLHGRLDAFRLPRMRGPELYTHSTVYPEARRFFAAERPAVRRASAYVRGLVRLDPFFTLLALAKAFGGPARLAAFTQLPEAHVADLHAETVSKRAAWVKACRRAGHVLPRPLEAA